MLGGERDGLLGVEFRLAALHGPDTLLGAARPLVPLRHAGVSRAR